MSQLIDLTATITEEMTNHPNHGRSPLFLDGTRMNHDQAEDTWRGKGVEDLSLVNGFVYIAEHNGTHIDAPFHLHPEGKTVDELDLEECHGPAVWLDVSDVGPKGAIGPDELETAAADAGVEVGAGDSVLLYTGWDEYVPEDRATYLEDHPGLSEAGAEWLYERDVTVVGIDCGNVDIAGDVSMPAHQVLLRDDAPDSYTLIVENLRNIDDIPAHRFTFSAAPLPLDDATASPIRAFAIVDD
ncbi:cyclase family protein [Natronorubrum daqingense]|uniref:Cyclase n=1 Tax=Natronorubrum daqingense TaxID=588898 RepID=A0A1N7ETE8_9EURY|nr:cyclase family protein [Natronorubrum daqingense]APX97729.1 cyclase [Natronorubrum daqingense]SIR91294.1 Kynurenine formamidase [Natronorubrum daqingense]